MSMGIRSYIISIRVGAIVIVVIVIEKIWARNIIIVWFVDIEVDISIAVVVREEVIIVIIDI